MFNDPNCQHDELQFNSGDYYVTCTKCSARWGRLAPDRYEYGKDVSGNPIGCCPEACTPGFRSNYDFWRRERSEQPPIKDLPPDGKITQAAMSQLGQIGCPVEE